MKKISFCILSVMLLFLFSCSVDDTLTPGQTDDQQGLSDDLNVRKAKGPVFTVEPSGDLTGIEDTDNLLDAFAEAKAAGPGAMVQLVEGQYTIGMIEVLDFDGYFVGAGKDNTIVKAKLGLPCREYMDENNVLPAIITFINGDITISDMTIMIPDGIACATETSNYGPELMNILVLADYSDLFHPENRFLKAKVSNVHFIGGNDDGSGPFGDYNTLIALWIGADFWWPLPGKEYPLTAGNITVKNCVFENLFGAGETANLGSDAYFSFENNILKSLPYGYFCQYNHGGDLYLINNHFQNCLYGDLGIDDTDWGSMPFIDLGRRTTYRISGNRFEPEAGGISISILDSRTSLYPQNSLPQLFEIKNNLFKLSDGNIGIICNNSQDGQVRNNRFIGSGTAGIIVDGAEVYDVTIGDYLEAPFAENVLILGNNFTGMESTLAHVVLGEKSMNCTVVGSGQGSILDNGVDNSISGLTPQIGPSLADNVKIGLINGIKPGRK